jgi:hypothetical protein
LWAVRVNGFSVIGCRVSCEERAFNRSGRREGRGGRREKLLTAMVGKNSREGHKEKIRVTADVPLPPFHSERMANVMWQMANGKAEEL